MADEQLRGAVLVVEDEDSVRLSLKRFLERRGHRVLLASDGLGAIKLLLDDDADVVVSDYRMEVLGGDYWVRFLKRFCADKKVIIATGFLNPDMAVDFPVLYKPFEYTELERLIQQALAELKGREALPPA